MLLEQIKSSGRRSPEAAAAADAAPTKMRQARRAMHPDMYVEEKCIAFYGKWQMGDDCDMARKDPRCSVFTVVTFIRRYEETYMSGCFYDYSVYS